MKVAFLLPPEILADPLEVDIPTVPRIGETVRICTMPLHAESMDDYAFRVTNVVHDLIAGELETVVELTHLESHDGLSLKGVETGSSFGWADIESDRLPVS